MLKKIFFLFFLMMLSSCYKNHLYVQVENIDNDFLASTHIGTPDYRKKDPPLGQRIIVSWDFPKKVYSKELFIHLTVRFWNNTEKLEVYQLHRRWGSHCFFFSNKTRDRKNKILTYRIQIYTKEGQLIETWKHQFWTELIDIDQENDLEEIHEPKEVTF